MQKKYEYFYIIVELSEQKKIEKIRHYLHLLESSANLKYLIDLLERKLLGEKYDFLIKLKIINSIGLKGAEFIEEKIEVDEINQKAIAIKYLFKKPIEPEYEIITIKCLFNRCLPNLEIKNYELVNSRSADTDMFGLQGLQIKCDYSKIEIFFEPFFLTDIEKKYNIQHYSTTEKIIDETAIEKTYYFRRLKQ